MYGTALNRHRCAGAPYVAGGLWRNTASNPNGSALNHNDELRLEHGYYRKGTASSKAKPQLQTTVEDRKRKSATQFVGDVDSIEMQPLPKRQMVDKAQVKVN